MLLHKATGRTCHQRPRYRHEKVLDEEEGLAFSTAASVQA